MTELSLVNLVKIYPYTKPKGLIGRKKAKKMLEEQMKMPFTTDEGVVILRGASLEIEKGELLVLLGESGCGKTTLLRMIAGLESVSDGDILVDGLSIEDWKPEERSVAMVFQNYSLYPHLTVKENIAFPLKTRHCPESELEPLVDETLKLLQLDKVADRLPADLSGGQQQRVALGRAIIRRPRFFLMDEPFSNLDPELRAKLRQTVRDINAQLHITTIYVTHDQTDALMMGTRIALMKDGRFLQVGSPKELYQRPNCLYAAGFIGDPAMNLPKAVFRRTEHGPAAEIAGCCFPVDNAPESLSDGDPVIAGIRPAALTRAEEGLCAKIVSAEENGAEVRLTLEAGAETLLCVLPSDRSGALLPGGTITVAPKNGKICLYDPKSGLLIN